VLTGILLLITILNFYWQVCAIWDSQ
jgi:hypothetical protein